ncbi:hypothetical protein B0J11DRAFT_347420 [Dendryphion nanum]|uniref:Uncharacterized protein n=1 Tax=Dendryphion nanum TaxID=256645 RepID=A0A9P9DL77_9PLEO|nr:hypothetical protein B0J11DRAFT_347420 [Dendryphion nanum]
MGSFEVVRTGDQSKQHNENSDRPKQRCIRSFFRLKPPRSISLPPIQVERLDPSPLVVAFVSTLNVENLSNMMIWILFYDISKYPPSPSRRYNHIHSKEVRGWIALGQYLASVTHGDLVFVHLHGICEQLELSPSLVYELLVRLGDPHKMGSSLFTSIIRQANLSTITELAFLRFVQEALLSLQSLIKGLKPTAMSDMWVPTQTFAAKSLAEFIAVIVDTKLAALEGVEAHKIDFSEEEEAKIRFNFEVMRKKRQVPLDRDGIYPNSTLSPSISTRSSHEVQSPITPPIISQTTVDQAVHLEESFSSFFLMNEIRSLRSQIRIMQDKKQGMELERKKLLEQNEKLARMATRKNANCVSTAIGHSYLSVDDDAVAQACYSPMVESYVFC